MISLAEALPELKFGIHDVVVELQVKETSYSCQIVCVAACAQVLHWEFRVHPEVRHNDDASETNKTKIAKQIMRKFVDCKLRTQVMYVEK